MSGDLELMLKRRVVVALNAQDVEEEAPSAAEALRSVDEGFQLWVWQVCLCRLP
jgi:hypothetical protein